MTANAQTVSATNGRAATQFRLIDCDVHHTLPTTKPSFPTYHATMSSALRTSAP